MLKQYFNALNTLNMNNVFCTVHNYLQKHTTNKFLCVLEVVMNRFIMHSLQKVFVKDLNQSLFTWIKMGEWFHSNKALVILKKAHVIKLDKIMHFLIISSSLEHTEINLRIISVILEGLQPETEIKSHLNYGHRK